MDNIVLTVFGRTLELNVCVTELILFNKQIRIINIIDMENRNIIIQQYIRTVSTLHAFNISL